MGYLDDMILVPAGLWLVVRLIPPDIMAEHRALAAAAQDRRVSLIAGIFVVGVWLILAALCGLLGYRLVVSRTGS